MVRSGIIWGAVSFVYLFVTNIAVLCCVPGEAILLGLLAGTFAGIVDHPDTRAKAAVRGMLAGLIASLGAIAGNLAGLAIRNSFVTTSTTVGSLTSQILSQSIPDVSYWISNIMLFGMCIVSDFILLASFGALGGLLWDVYRQRKGGAANQH